MRFSLMMICYCFIGNGLSAQYQVSGIITDSITQTPIADVYIELLEFNKWTVSDRSGTYVLPDIPAGNYNLQFSHISFQTQNQAITTDDHLEVNLVMKPSIYQLNPVEVIHHWVNQDAPVPQVFLDEHALQKYNSGQDLPYLIRSTPSLLITSDAGNGVGYTGMRIRGSDATRINVTINGVPLNDSESQGVFWVDLPDLGSSISNLQIQRGVGSSTHGAGAFGASINLNTQRIKVDPQVSTQHSIGSFNTRMHNLEFSSGTLKKHFTIDSRLSTVHSDGYIDRATADLNSYYLSGTYFNDHQSISFLTFGGKERTYQAWNGVPAQYVNDADLRKFNSAGTERSGDPHADEVDDYTQNHYQLVYREQRGNWDWNGTLHLTRGNGFFEQYKANQDLIDYDIKCETIPEIDQTDLIRRRWLDNYFYGGLFSISKKSNSGILTTGTAINRYEGRHFGEVIWAQYSCEVTPGHLYYDNDAVKNDANIYVKQQWFFSKWKPFLDLQYRYIDYKFMGIDDDGSSLKHQVSHQFFNPKAGIQYQFNPNTKFNLFVGIAHKEPNRDDYTEANPKSWPVAEVLYDGELGIQNQHKKFQWDVNLYYMYYRNQLVLNGEINDVGAYTRINIDRSYRLGLELTYRFPVTNRLILEGNTTLSRNRIANFIEFIDDWDTGQQIQVAHENSKIAFSPDFMGFQKLDYYLYGAERSAKHFMISLEGKYVSRQYLDNTENKLASINPYFSSDLFLQYQWQSKHLPAIRIFSQIQNIFNKRYNTNGWIYRFQSKGYDPLADDPYARRENNQFYHLAGYYPQSTRNFTIGIQLSL